MADLTSLYADRASLGVIDTLVPISPLRIVGTPAAAAGSIKLSLDAQGNVTAGALAVGDLPLGSDWTWGAGAVIGFAPGALAPPAPTSRSLGTRLVLEPVAGSTEYAVGREAGALWTSVPVGAAHTWYQGATARLRLDADGTLQVINGSGALQLGQTGSAAGSVFTYGALSLSALGGGLTVSTSSGLVLPQQGYFENLGQIHRKYLSLHAAELWVETLVAQDTLATIGGRILVGPTTTLTRDVGLGDTTIYVKHNAFQLHEALWEYGSKLVLQAAGKFEVMAVDAQTPPVVTAQGDYGYLVVRATGGTAHAWYAGDAVFDTGKQYTTGAHVQSASGFIDLYSVRGLNAGTTAGPTIVGNVRTGPGPTDWREHWAIGNLKGIYAYTATTFGAAFGDTNGTHLEIDATTGVAFRAGNAGTTKGTVLGSWNVSNILTLGIAGGSQIILDPMDGAIRMTTNGVDKIVLLSTGVALLHHGLVLGSATGTTPYLRSASATAWNAGHGFYFDAIANTGVGRALIGNSAGRRVQWDGTSLKIISDGFTLDENGIQLAQSGGSGADAGRRIVWGITGALLWDTSVAGDARFEILRASGKIRIEASATGGPGIELMAGGTGIDRVRLSLNSVLSGTGQLLLGWDSSGGVTMFPPRFVPQYDALADIGSTVARWRSVYSYNVYATLIKSTGYVAAGNATPNNYWLEVGADSAAKPVSSTWTIAPSDRAAKDDITPVDIEAALAIVRRVPLVRFRYNGALGSPAGVAGIGVVAQDLEPILPESVQRGHSGKIGWNAHELFVLNVAAVQALAARVDALEGHKDGTR
jgi:hypothetical protein